MGVNVRGLLKVEYVPIASVKPAKGNARVHPPEQIKEIVALVEEYGWTNPIVVDERREILAGHGRLQAAQQMGMVDVPILARHGLSQAQKRAYRIADNKTASKSAWDDALLKDELEALRTMGFDIALTGFQPGEIDALLRPSPGPHQEPRLPDAGPPVSKLGDLWHLGDHRLACADSTKPVTYQALMAGHVAALIFTDPPYGVSYKDKDGKFEEITGDQLRRGQLTSMLHGAFAQAIVHSDREAAWYLWHADKTGSDFQAAARDVGLVLLGTIIWVKPGAVMGWMNYHQAHEPCFYMARQGVKPAFYAPRDQTTVWRLTARQADGSPVAVLGSGMTVATPDGAEIHVAAGAPKGRKVRHVQVQPGETLKMVATSEADDVWEVARDGGHGKEEGMLHPTMKPVELARRAIVNSSREGEIVLDMFAGSGSTLMAAEQAKRCCYAIELDPVYVDVIVRRWQTLTGKTATHAQEQKTFEAIATARGKKKSR